jgi:cation-dependent mannose-6-phosphate receptor
MIAIMVYIVGGCVYQRTVMHQRGWRQLPNYNLWSGCASGLAVSSTTRLIARSKVADAVQDCFIILTSSCMRFVPKRRGYSRVSGNGYGRGRSSHNDDENRLIDQLDEEWDD